MWVQWCFEENKVTQKQFGTQYFWLQNCLSQFWVINFRYNIRYHPKRRKKWFKKCCVAVSAPCFAFKWDKISFEELWHSAKSLVGFTVMQNPIWQIFRSFRYIDIWMYTKVQAKILSFSLVELTWKFYYYITYKVKNEKNCQI